MRKQLGRRIAELALGITLGGAFACSSPSTPELALDVAEGDDVKVTDEEQWLRDQQRLRVILPDQSVIDWPPSMLFFGPTGGIGPVTSTCHAALNPTNAFTSCEAFLRDVLESLCIAKTALAIANVQSTPLRIGTTSVYTIPPQSEETSAAVAAHAYAAAQQAIHKALNYALSDPATAQSDCPTYLAGVLDGRTIAGGFASALVEAYYTGKEAYERAVEANLNVSDKLRASTRSPTLSASRSVSGALLSRAAAAHLLVGGDAGILGSTDKALCLDRSLSPQGKSALQLLRDAGVSPTSLSLDVPILLDGTATGTGATGSVRQRLGAFYNHPEFLTTTRSVTSFYKIDEPAFREARDYLVQEVAAFSRSPDAQIAPVSGTPAYKRYSATATEPMELPPGAWAARARYNTVTPDALTKNILKGEAVAWSHNLSEFTWATLSAIRPILAFKTFPSAAAHAEVMGPLGALNSAEEYKGAIEIQGTGNARYAMAIGFTPADRLRIVRGEDGLRCAVDGSIEGASCAGTTTPCPAGQTPTLACLTVAPFDTTTLAAPSLFYGFDRYVEVTFNVTGLDPKTRLYVVKPKTTTITLEPGNFDVVAGFTLAQRTVVPVIPTVERRVAEILAPSKQNCGIPQESCAGTQMDARLPLEDDLSKDGEEGESSWRRYLDLAKQAATEADVLGQDYLNAKFDVVAGQAADEIRLEEQRRRAEESLQTVQSICGTSIDSRRLLTLVSGTSGNDLSRTVLAQSCPSPACPSGYNCMAGRCVVNLKAIANANPNDPELGRLAECLNLSQYDFVSLGDRPLCVQVNNQNPNKICESTFPGGCPFVRPDTGCGTSTAGTTLKESFPLGYFEQKGPPPSAACDFLRQLRTTPSAVANGAYQNLVKSNVMNPLRIRDLSPDIIRWSAKYGGYSDLIADDEVKFTTGSYTTGPAPGWPCAASPGCTAATQKSFFCSSATCTDPAARAKMNLRLFRATAAASYMKDVDRRGRGRSCGSDDCLLGWWAVPMAGGNCGNSSTLTYHNQGNIPIAVCDDNYIARTNTQPGSDGWYTLLASGAAQRVPGETGIKFSQTIIGKNSGFAGERKDFEFFAGLYEPTNNGGGWAFKNLTFAIRPYELPEFPLIVDAGPNSLVPTQTMDPEAYLDGLELLCELSNAELGQRAIRPPSLNTLESIEAAGDYLQSLANAVTAKAATSLAFANVPKIAADAMRQASATGVFPAVGGRMAEQVAGLREAFIQSAEAAPIIGSAMNQMGAEMKALRARLQQADVAQELADWRLASTTLDRLTDCASSMSDTVGNLTSFGAKSAIECANAAAQIGIAIKVNSLEKLSAELNKQIDTANFAERMSQLTETLQTTALKLAESTERIDATLASIDGLKNEAESALGRAVYLASWNSEKQAEFNKASGTLSVAKQIRYNRALKNARLMAFVAKRAMEQRIGMRLSELTDDLPLVEAPRNWEASVCTLSGINYDQLATGNTTAFTDGFIGDYVTKLENVVESYRMAYNFHEGQDTAIVSLRDDVMNVRESCAVPSRNLLRSSERLTDANTWSASGCLSVTYAGTPRTQFNCIAPVLLATPRPASEMPPISPKPFPDSDSDLSGTMGFQVVFGDGNSCAAPLSGGPCGWQAGALWAQTLTLQPGSYRLSWYTAETLASPTGHVAVKPAAGGAALALTASASTLLPHPSWNRYSVTFSVMTAADYLVGFTSPSSTLPLASARMTVAAPMLEGLPGSITTQYLPSFEKTDEDGLASLPACENTEGDVFRAKHWQRKCVRLCDGGFNNNCTDGPLHCYRELSFGVTQSWIQNGQLFNYSGFARGNFNYRIDSIALNFVGTAVRDCEESTLPNTCYSAAYVPYSFQHDGPFYVRNHIGDDFRAWLFDGRIEHARGLAAERYLTNPLSATDRELLADYLRPEFQGRPLDGNFILRVWEEPGVNFDGIQDVQLLLNYRYWTRFE